MFAATLPFYGLAMGGLRQPWAWACAAVLIWACVLRSRRLALPPAAWAWGAWLLWGALSALASPGPLLGLASWLAAASAFLFLPLGLGAAKEEKAAGCAGLWLCALLIGLSTCLVPVPSYPWVGLLHPYHNYAAALQAASFAAALFALGAGIPGGRGGRLALAALMALHLALLALSHSRGGLLACALAGTLALWRKGRGRELLLAGSLLLLALSLAPARKLVPLLKLDHLGAQVRPSLWRSALAVARDHPILGQGPGQFERGFLRHNFPSPPLHRRTRYGLRSAYAHSEILQTAAELGWPGLAFFLIAVLAALAPSLSHRGPWTSEAALGAFLALALQSIWDNVLALPALRLLFFYLLAAALPRSATRRALDIPKWAAVAGITLSSLAWWPRWALSAWGSQRSEPAVRKALRLAPDSADLWENLAKVYLAASPPRTKDALEALARAGELNPTNALYPLMAGETLRGEGAWKAALTCARLAAELEPHFLQARLLETEALARLGRREAALESWRRLQALGGSSPDEELPKKYDEFVDYQDAARRGLVRRLLEPDLPAAAVEPPTGTVDSPAGTVDLPAGTVDLPAGTVDLPAGTVLRLSP